MARMTAGGLVREIDCVVFDKDGTLIDFHPAWRGRLVRAIAAVCERADLKDPAGSNLRDALYRALGAEPSSGRMFPDGPYVSASIAEACTIASTVLYQWGVSWPRAKAIVDAQMRPIFVAVPLDEELVAIGDVAGLLQRLRRASVRVAIATNDEREGTLAGLEALGIAGLFDAIVCAGDAGLMVKPAPDGLLHIARCLGLRPERLAMVGDAVSDLTAGRAAGAGLIVGVLSGPATAAHLEPHADVVVADVHALGIEGLAVVG